MLAGCGAFDESAQGCLLVGLPAKRLGGVSEQFQCAGRPLWRQARSPRLRQAEDGRDVSRRRRCGGRVDQSFQRLLQRRTLTEPSSRPLHIRSTAPENFHRPPPRRGPAENAPRPMDGRAATRSVLQPHRQSHLPSSATRRRRSQSRQYRRWEYCGCGRSPPVGAMIAKWNGAAALRNFTITR